MPKPCDFGTSCGISTPFGVLFPTVWQVAHALLTRPPLRHSIHSTVENATSHTDTSPSYHSVNRVSPFDLHVLGAPPAFVLSQDQTLDNLYLNAIACAKTNLKLCSSLFLKKINSNPACARPECYKGLLYISQCCLIFKVRPASLGGEIYSSTSKNFCQQLSLFFVAVAQFRFRSLADSFAIISCPQTYVNRFLN